MSADEPAAWLSRPLEELVSGVARSVAEEQAALDRQSLSTERDVRRAVAAGELDAPIDPAWFRFAGVEADLNVALSVRARPERDDDGTVRAYRPVLVAAPTDPQFTTRHDYDVTAASRVSLDIVPVPRPE
ncbi:MAG: hypothetical protein ABEJ82_02880 [Haloplanus sp.]